MGGDVYLIYSQGSATRRHTSACLAQGDQEKNHNKCQTCSRQSRGRSAQGWAVDTPDTVTVEWLGSLSYESASQSASKINNQGSTGDSSFDAISPCSSGRRGHQGARAPVHGEVPVSSSAHYGSQRFPGLDTKNISFSFVPMPPFPVMSHSQRPMLKG